LWLLLVLGNVALAVEIARHAVARWRGPARHAGTGTGESRRDQFRALARAGDAAPAAIAADVVLAGDSLVALGEWSELLPHLTVHNRGVAGDTSGDLLARIDDAVAGNPRAVLIAVGINDLLRDQPPAAIAETQARILARIRARSPGTRVLVAALLPIRRALVERPGAAAHIPAVNRELAALARSAGATFVDATPALADREGDLDARYTTDGVHLTGAGYLAWRGALAKALAEALPGPAPATAGGPDDRPSGGGPIRTD
jgi:lysophospholipase L1-like esterase